MTTTDIVVPVFHEERRLAKHLPHLHGFLKGRANLQWRSIIPNNGSTDRTEAVAKNLSRTQIHGERDIV